MAYIGIDIGTTGICVTKVAAGGEVLETRHAANDAVMHVDQPFARLQDPTRIETIVRSLLQSMLADTEGIGISCQMHGILYVDRSGRAVSMVENCCMASECCYRGVDAIPDDAGYFSLIIANRVSPRNLGSHIGYSEEQQLRCVRQSVRHNKVI